MSEPVKIGILGGTGLYKMEGFSDVREVAVPALAQMPSGCRFRNRCSYATDACGAATPPHWWATNWPGPGF